MHSTPFNRIHGTGLLQRNNFTFTFTVHFEDRRKCEIMKWEALENKSKWGSRLSGKESKSRYLYGKVHCITFMRQHSPVTTCTRSINTRDTNQRSGNRGTEFVLLNGMWLCYRLDNLGFESRQGQNILLFCKTSIPSLGPTHPLVQLLPGFFPRNKGVRMLTIPTHFHVMPKLKIALTFYSTY